MGMQASKNEVRTLRFVESYLPPLAIVILYFLGVSLFGVGLALPVAFFWMVWYLGKKIDRMVERVEKVAAR